MMTVRPERRALTQALATEGERVVELVRGCRDTKAPVPGLAWTFGQLVAHLTGVFLVFEQALSGEFQNPDLDAVIAGAGPRPALAQAIAAANEYAVSLLTLDDAQVAADGLAAQLSALSREVEAADDLDREVSTPWYGRGMTRTVGTLASLAVTEAMVHGRDLARAVHADTAMSRISAAAVLPTVMSAMLPLLLDTKRAKGFRGVFELRVRGGGRLVVRIADGQAECFEAGERGVDCVINLDPRAALLLSFRRTSLARTTLTGAAISSGRKPWLGLRFPGLFVAP